MSKQKDKDIPTLCLYLSDQLYAKIKLYAKWKLLNWRNNETFCSTLCQLSANMTYEMPWVNKNNKICPKLTNLNHSAAVLLSIIEAYCLWDQIKTLGFLCQFSIRRYICICIYIICWEIQRSLHYLNIHIRRRINISHVEIKWLQKVGPEWSYENVWQETSICANLAE